MQFTDVTHPDDDSDSEPESEPMTICEGDVWEFFIHDEFNLNMQYEEEVWILQPSSIILHLLSGVQLVKNFGAQILHLLKYKDFIIHFLL